MKKILCLTLICFVLLTSLTACSKAPEYSEIEERFKELVEASYEVNAVIFGEGLPTYERVYDPLSTLQVHTVTDPENEENVTRIYYYELQDEAYGSVIAYRTSYLVPYSYVQVLDTPDSSKKPVYVDEKEKIYCYALEQYTEPEYEFFYEQDDPTAYDYIRLDCGYLSVNDIKELAQTVYTPEYLESIYEWLFVGTAGVTESVDGLSARFVEYSNEEGETYLMQSNTFEPLIRERRVYDFSTAEMVKPSNKEYVNIEIDSYLESKPSKVLRVRISMQLVNGVWMLDSATY